MKMLQFRLIVLIGMSPENMFCVTVGWPKNTHRSLDALILLFIKQTKKQKLKSASEIVKMFQY